MLCIPTILISLVAPISLPVPPLPENSWTVSFEETSKLPVILSTKKNIPYDENKLTLLANFVSRGLSSVNVVGEIVSVEYPWTTAVPGCKITSNFEESSGLSSKDIGKLPTV